MPIQQGMGRHWIPLVALTLTLTGCAASEPTPTPAVDVVAEREAALLAELAQYTTLDMPSDERLIRAGYKYCDDLATQRRPEHASSLIWAQDNYSYADEDGILAYSFAAAHALSTLCSGVPKP